MAVSISSGYTSGRNLYTSGQCTYYVFDRVGGKIGSTWGNASNWANAAARAGYTVNNTPKLVQLCKQLKVHTVTLHTLKVLTAMVQ